LRNFLLQYSRFQREDVIEGEDDVFRLTPDEIKAEVTESYSELWKLRKRLLQMGLEDEAYFLDISDSDLGMYPTLFDYLILNWTNYILASVDSRDPLKSALQNAELLLVETFDRSVNLKDPPALLVAELMEEASHQNNKIRQEARERWKIKRLLLPLRHHGLYVHKDYARYQNRAREILLAWKESFKTAEARAEAGYETAAILRSENKLVEAVRLCRIVERDFPGTHASRHAEILRSQIQMPALNLRVKHALPPAREALIVTTRNIKRIYFRLYRIEPHQMKEEMLGSSRSFNGWSNVFSSPREPWLKESLPGKSPHREWDTQVKDQIDHKGFSGPIAPPELETGVYLVLASGDNSFKMGRSLMSACFLNVTDLVLLGTGGFTVKANDAYYDYIDREGPGTIEDSGFRLYALNAKTGKPAEFSDLDVFTQFSGRSNRESFQLRTDREGLAELSLPVSISPRSSNYYRIDPLAKHKTSYAYWNHNQSINHYPPSPIVLFLETDRPIYRPGHSVQAKVVTAWRRPQGFKTISSGKTVRFYATDTNNKEFFSKNVELNDFGSASVSFEIPHGRLLGRYKLHATCHDGRFSNHTSIPFTVEEYKRPEFEIQLKSAVEPWKFNIPVEIKGSVSYYFGGPVPDAPVQYRIKRQTYIPYHFRHWFGGSYSGSGQEIASGQLKTDAEGNFSITFTPTAPPQRYSGIPDMTQFTVEVDGRDSGGRTIETQQSYKAGKSAVYFVIEPQKGFFLENESIKVDSKRLTINDTPAPGDSDYEVFLLDDTPTKTLAETGYGHYGGYWRWMPPLDAQLKDVPNGELIARGTVKHDKDGSGMMRIKPLPQGVYRIVQKTKDKWGDEVTQNKILVVARSTQEAVPVSAATVTLVEKDEYEVGETARFIIGSGLADGIYHIELWVGQHFLQHVFFDNQRPVQMVEIPVTGRMKGGFSLRWFGVKDFDIHNGEATVAVPWKEKKLTVHLKPFQKDLKPGQETTWGVQLRDAEDRPVQGETLALMYDRSLEYYMTTQNPWLDSLYALQTTRVFWNQSVFEPYASSVPVTEGLLAKLLKAFRQPPEEPRPPALRSWRTWARGGYYARHRGMLEEEEMSMDAVKEAPLSKSEIGGMEKISGEIKDFRYEEASKKVKTRKEFADTAFFRPHVVTGKNGRGTFTFAVPEQLSSWKIKLLAFDRDVKEGVLTEEAVTRKDLMVRVDLPRFFREKDRGTVTAVVHNESDKPMQGELFIDVTEDGKSVHQKIKLLENKKRFALKPHSLEAFNWMIEIPQGVSTFKVRVAAVAEKLSDAEERELPILPSRQRLIESAVAALHGSESKILEILLKDDPTRIDESMVLQVEPQLALSILNTIPFLIEYPYECVEQILNKYVPLSIMNEIYKKYPAIKSAVSKIPDRRTPTPPWEKDAPQRLITLMETPWIWQSEGRPTIWPLIDMLDPQIVKAQKDVTFSKLRAAQLSNGAFPWWPGGKADPYMTLYVLAGLAEAQRYGVDVPQDMIQRALNYVNEKIPLMLEPEERSLATVSYAAYVVTSYSPEEFSEAKKGLDAARSWVVFIERHRHALTPLGRAYLAFTFLRLGNRDKAQDMLDSALDGAREDKIAGVYWTPEKYSWVWYSDSVEKHAFFLRTLQELRPEDRRIPGMVQWLLFSRKGTVWKSTKASVAAVYALLDYLNQRGALTADETFRIKWAKDVYSQVVKADDWLDKPLRWQKKGFEITQQHSRTEVKKDGPGIAFASLTWTYTTDQLPEESGPGMLQLQRKFFRRAKEGDSYHLKPLKSGDKVSVGDQIEVQLKINTRSQFEYMHLKDPKASGFEAEALLSGWRHDPLWFYEEQRDSLTNFFLSWLPHGEYILRYRLKPTKPGIYRVGASTLQSMYSPDMSAHSAGFIIEVSE
jgi:uncharacterized protein YfaS (alpha-2-macroglobulin family)